MHDDQNVFPTHHHEEEEEEDVTTGVIPVPAAVREAAANLIGHASIAVTTLNVLCTVVGGAVLALPAAIERMSFVPGFIFMGITCFLSWFAVTLVSKSCARTGLMTFQDLVIHASNNNYWFVRFFFFGLLAFPLGIIVAFMKVIGESMPAVMKFVIGSNTNKTTASGGGVNDDAAADDNNDYLVSEGFWICLATIILIPLSSFREMSELVWVSIIGFGTVLFTGISIIYLFVSGRYTKFYDPAETPSICTDWWLMNRSTTAPTTTMTPTSTPTSTLLPSSTTTSATLLSNITYNLTSTVIHNLSGAATSTSTSSAPSGGAITTTTMMNSETLATLHQHFIHPGVALFDINLEDFFVAFPVMTMALTCHNNVPFFYGELRKRSEERMMKAVYTAGAFTTVFYLAVGIAGYFVFGPSIKLAHGNVLNCMSWHDTIVMMCRTLMAVHFLCVFPINCIGARRVLNRIIYPDIHESKLSQLKLTLQSVCLVGISAIVAYEASGIEVVFSINGSLFGLLMTFALPSYCYIRLVNPCSLADVWKSSRAALETSSVASDEVQELGDFPYNDDDNDDTNNNNGNDDDDDDDNQLLAAPAMNDDDSSSSDTSYDYDSDDDDSECDSGTDDDDGSSTEQDSRDHRNKQSSDHTTNLHPHSQQQRSKRRRRRFEKLQTNEEGISHRDYRRRKFSGSNRNNSNNNDKNNNKHKMNNAMVDDNDDNDKSAHADDDEHSKQNQTQQSKDSNNKNKKIHELGMIHSPGHHQLVVTPGQDREEANDDDDDEEDGGERKERRGSQGDDNDVNTSITINKKQRRRRRNSPPQQQHHNNGAGDDDDPMRLLEITQGSFAAQAKIDVQASSSFSLQHQQQHQHPSQSNSSFGQQENALARSRTRKSSHQEGTQNNNDVDGALRTTGQRAVMMNDDDDADDQLQQKGNTTNDSNGAHATTSASSSSANRRRRHSTMTPQDLADLTAPREVREPSSLFWRISVWSLLVWGCLGTVCSFIFSLHAVLSGADTMKAE